MFGFDRFNNCLAQTGQTRVAAAGASIFEAIDQHAGTTAQSDDITLMLLQLAAAPASPAAATATATAGRSFPRGEKLTSRVLEWLQHTLQQLAVPPAIHMELALVAEEIVTNADKYAELPAGAAIELTVEATTRAITLQVRDRGTAFNPLQQSRRSTLGASIDSAEIGGLGVHLITQLTDEQDYRRVDGHNVLRVTKLLPEDPT